jgi:hypothetical protein
LKKGTNIHGPGRDPSSREQRANESEGGGRGNENEDGGLGNESGDEQGSGSGGDGQAIENGEEGNENGGEEGSEIDEESDWVVSKYRDVTPSRHPHVRPRRGLVRSLRCRVVYTNTASIHIQAVQRLLRCKSPEK